MNNNLTKECIVTKKYIKKDGSISERKYTVKYALSDKANKITQTKILDKVKEIKRENFSEFYNLVNEYIERKNMQT